MRYRHSGDQPVYAPNSFGGPAADPVRFPDPSWDVSGEIVRTAYTLHSEDDDYGQPGTLVRNVLSDTDRDHLVHNITTHLKPVQADIQRRSVEHWRKVDERLGDRIAEGLGIAVAAGV
jgi:catalase